jgi:HAD superfamily hydrolase (TIGR01509 family)
MKKAIIFDNDGVLVDTEILYFKATKEILASQGASLTLEMFIDSNIKSNRSAWHMLDKSPEELKALKKLRNDRYTELLSEGDLSYSGVHEVINELSEKYRLCIVTTSRKMHFEAIHQWTDYLGHFEFVITVDDVTNSKPHPEPYLKALERLELPATDCVVIEDSYRGMKSAASAGIDCLMVQNAFSQFQEFDEAIAVVDNISEVPGVIEKL